MAQSASRLVNGVEQSVSDFALHSCGCVCSSGERARAEKGPESEECGKGKETVHFSKCARNLLLKLFLALLLSFFPLPLLGRNVRSRDEHGLSQGRSGAPQRRIFRRPPPPPVLSLVAPGWRGARKPCYIFNGGVVFLFLWRRQRLSNFQLNKRPKHILIFRTPHPLLEARSSRSRTHKGRLGHRGL